MPTDQIESELLLPSSITNAVALDMISVRKKLRAAWTRWSRHLSDALALDNCTERQHPQANIGKPRHHSLSNHLAFDLEGTSIG